MMSILNLKLSRVLIILFALTVMRAAAEGRESELGVEQATTTNSLTVVVNDLDSRMGQVIISVFNDSASFLENPLLRLTKKVDTSDSLTFTFSNLARGRYSISAFCDLNSDGELNTNFIGIPIEPVGFSNNAKGSFGPPSFADSSFEFYKKKTVYIDLVAIID
jgi:uncharacterized protein (DUF2141 family)